MRFSLRFPVVRYQLASLCAGSSNWWPLVLYASVRLCDEWFRTSLYAQERYSTSTLASRLCFVELIKLSLSITYTIWRRRAELRGQHPVADQAFFDELRDEVNGGSLNRRPESHAPVSQHNSSRSVGLFSTLRGAPVAYVILASSSCALYNYNVAIAQEITDPFTVYLIASLATLFTMVLSLIFLSRPFNIVHWQAAFLQLCGFFVIQVGLIINPPSQSSHPILISTAISSSLFFVLLDHMYITHDGASLTLLHNALFASGFVIHAAVFITRDGNGFHSLARGHPYQIRPEALVGCFLQAASDLTALAVTFYRDAATEGIVTSFSVAMFALLVSFHTGLYMFIVCAGCWLVIVASITYLSHHSDGGDEQSHGKRQAIPFRRVLGGVLLLSSMFYVAHTASREEILQESPGRPSTIVDILRSALSRCRRRTLPSLTFWPSKRTYHTFDDVLLIVFFSHARYDANLDYYKEVYSQFFPNIIFVGPGSREDAGFAHSYDVFVDSYQSDEDLSDSKHYKMAGRMAHHMLYTVMKEHECYDGYLWAPFDTLLNIPRLQQFNQDYFWYHSPFGEYVPNPALGDAEANNNKSRHAPAANISPDPEIDLTSTWRGWGPDWWWGDPHVGLAVCMQAFHKVPFHMQQRLAAFTNGTTRLIGGSADTLYIPGRHRQAFLDTLGTFLETDCFLEIATPTVVHLVVPHDEPILFVDHWWIWQPPFNATFVRQMWSEGHEVDTFHTFHWGDRGPDGIWKSNPDHIPDVRRLLAESAQRQGLDFP
ncbi:hypothetical protein AcW1_007678 [Taiwanofungus camphoratus]|nr:hypothetical protein AcV7_009882 [Antrodia cinnamomea]KAI0953466.1 hypothetical protein AcW1_007678 [Antrodia cinnamomea]